MTTIPAYFLSPQQQAVGRLLAQGCSDKQITRALVIEPRILQRHIEAILRKTDCNSRLQAALVLHDIFTPIATG